MSDSGNINQTWTLDGADDFIAQLRRIAAEAEKTQAAMSGANDKAATSVAGLEAATTSLSAAFRELSGFAGAAAGPIEKILSSLSGLTTGFGAIGTAIVGVTAGLGALAHQGAETADQIRDGALRVGTSAEQYSTLKFALQQSGAGAEGFERAMGKVFEASNTAETAADNTEAAAKKISTASDSFATTQQKISDLFLKTNRDLADEQRKANEQIFDLTRKKGTQEEEIRFQQNRRIQEIERQQSRALNDIIVQRNRDAQKAADDLAKSEQEAADKAEKADAFTKLGVKLKGANGQIRDTADIFKDVAEQVSKIENPTARSAKAMELFSRRAGPKLVEALSLGREGITKLQEEAKELGLQFTKLQTEVGDNFNDAMHKLSGTIKATADKIGLLFAPAFTAIAETLAKSFGSLQAPILVALQPIADDFTNLFSGNIDKVKSQFLLGMRDIIVGVVVPAFQLLGNVVGSVLTAMGAGFQAIADVINAVFGTKFTAVDIPAFIIAIKLGAAAIGVLTTAFTALRVAMLANPFTATAVAVIALAAVVIENWTPIKEFFQSLPDTFDVIGIRLQRLGEQQGGVLGGIVKVAGDFISALGKLFNGDLKGAADTFAMWWKDFLTLVFVTTLDAAAEFAKQKLSDLGDFFIRKFKEIGTDIANIIGNAFSGAAARVGGTGGGGGDAPQNNRAGGMIRGRGTGTSDSILSWISNGEFIINAAATRIFRPLLEAINRGKKPSLAGAPKGFALGGSPSVGIGGLLGRSVLPATSSVNRFAPGTSGFSGTGGRPFTLVIDSRTFGGLTASEDTVRDFVKFAQSLKIRSLGRKVSYYGNG